MCWQSNAAFLPCHGGMVTLLHQRPRACTLTGLTISTLDFCAEKECIHVSLTTKTAMILCISKRKYYCFVLSDWSTKTFSVCYHVMCHYHPWKLQASCDTFLKSDICFFSADSFQHVCTELKEKMIYVKKCALTNS